MEILSPSSYFSNSNWLLEESGSTKWTPAENKAFENALALYDKDTPDRWQKVAKMVPGKTEWDVIRQYKVLEDDVSNIEAGLIPIPGYSMSSPFTLEWGSGHGFDGFDHAYVSEGKRSSSIRPNEHERKKGVPWTEEEHKLFLMGLKKYGKGDWRNISRNFVITRTPTQVASHAQKYFIRQLSGGKDKRRASIHDITTVNLNENQNPSPENKKPPSPEPSAVLPRQSNSAPVQKHTFHWNRSPNDAVGGFQPGGGLGNMFSPPYAVNSYGHKMQGQLIQRGGIHESLLGSQNMGFQMQSGHYFPHA
ncbi:transcription factor DIVARICATA [Olea europaea subsp. europaea]|uniref:Transcription factor DIVARICATA n=1 Tax=Olea europaea subsp. europaea TaxID=158383 RepID=A0A8S0PIA9_OLEEU|nr:transcription factor DIVARICATA [Olea europaea subsp. europaea]